MSTNRPAAQTLASAPARIAPRSNPLPATDPPHARTVTSRQTSALNPPDATQKPFCSFPSSAHNPSAPQPRERSPGLKPLCVWPGSSVLGFEAVTLLPPGREIPPRLVATPGARTGFADWVRARSATLTPRSSRQAARFHAVHQRLSTLALPGSFPDAPCSPSLLVPLLALFVIAVARCGGGCRLCAGSRQARGLSLPCSGKTCRRFSPLSRSTRFSVLGFIPSPTRGAKRGNEPSP